MPDGIARKSSSAAKALLSAELRIGVGQLTQWCREKDIVYHAWAALSRRLKEYRRQARFETKRLKAKSSRIYFSWGRYDSVEQRAFPPPFGLFA